MSVIFTILSVSCLPIAMLLLTELGPALCCSVEVLSFEEAGQAMHLFCLSLAVCFGEKEQDTHTVVDESLIQQLLWIVFDFEMVEIAESQPLHVEAGPSSAWQIVQVDVLTWGFVSNSADNPSVVSAVLGIPSDRSTLYRCHAVRRTLSQRWNNAGSWSTVFLWGEVELQNVKG